MLAALRPAVKAVRSARPWSHRPMPLSELMWPSCPTPILGTPHSAASCSATCDAQYGSLSLDTIRPGSSSGRAATAVKLDAAARKRSPSWSGGDTKNAPRASHVRVAPAHCGPTSQAVSDQHDVWASRPAYGPLDRADPIVELR